MSLLFSSHYLLYTYYLHMAIYTKQGDRGTTSLYGESKKRTKDDLRIEAYGTIDELNSHIGSVISFLTPKTKKLRPHLLEIQKDLFEIASCLATSLKQVPPFRVGHNKTRRLEKLIDELEGSLPVLQNFIFPGGGKVGASLHIARTVCRRAERRIVALSKKEKIDSEILIYINRLSDALFMVARWANKLEDRKEEIWRGK